MPFSPGGQSPPGEKGPWGRAGEQGGRALIAGVGIDLCRVSRMLRAVRSRHFVERVFRPEEIAYAEARGNARARAASYASAFAAREAFAKASGLPLARVALGSGFRLLRERGAPRIALSPDIEASFLPALSKRVWVSLTHDGDYAAAVVVIEAERG